MQQFISAYRIVSPRWADEALSGEGARLYGGRWNSVGTPMVYCAGSRALAALELLVHLTTPLSRAKLYQIIEIQIPAELAGKVDSRSLPGLWRESPPSRESQKIGDDWSNQSRSPALLIPSAIVPEENNILLNPDHPDFSKTRIISTTNFSFDRRLQGSYD